jgi:hypothetical protein
VVGEVQGAAQLSNAEVLQGFVARFGMSPGSALLAAESAMTCADLCATDGNGPQKSSEFEHFGVREALTSLESD